MKKYGLDKDGFIFTEVSSSKIDPVFKKKLKKITNVIVKLFGDKIHSLYLYGSVATGKAQIKSSDLDLLLVLNEKTTSKIKNELSKLQTDLTKKHKSTFRDVGISLTHTTEIKKDTNGWGCFIKHLCVCLHGENLGKNLPKFKPSKKVAKAFNGDIEKHINTTLKQLQLKQNPEQVKSICSSMMRKIVRTGFCLVMAQEESWTTDLNNSYEIFSKYYPKQSTEMKKALLLAKKPTTNVKELEKFLIDFGSWLSKEVKKKL